MSPVRALPVRVNITCAGTLLALSESGAIVQLPNALRIRRQTTLVIQDENGMTLYIPGHVVSTEPCAPSGSKARHHRIAMEFFALPWPTIAAIQRLVEQRLDLAAALPPLLAADTHYERVA